MLKCQIDSIWQDNELLIEVQSASVFYVFGHQTESECILLCVCAVMKQTPHYAFKEIQKEAEGHFLS